MRGKATIGNMAFRKPDGEDLDPGRDPIRYDPWAPAGATPKIPPLKTRIRSKTDTLIDVPEYSSGSP
eukprot:4832532-Pyramimonas_sp.AAC.1